MDTLSLRLRWCDTCINHLSPCFSSSFITRSSNILDFGDTLLACEAHSGCCVTISLSCLSPWWRQLRTRGPWRTLRHFACLRRCTASPSRSVLLSAILTLVAAALQSWPVNRFRVEGLLPSLPKLLDSSRDHTVIETMTVRHVYFSMVSLSLIVITNRFSNVLGDSVTLRLLLKVTQVVRRRMRLTLTSHLKRSCFFFSSALGCDMHHHLVLVRFKNFAPMTSKDQAMVVLRSYSCLCAHFQLFLSLWSCVVSPSHSCCVSKLMDFFVTTISD